MARVGMVAYTHYHTDSRVRREAEALAERGDSVDFICLGMRGEQKIEILGGVRLIKVIVGRYRGADAGMYVASYLGFFLAVTIKLAMLHFKRRYQVIQVHTMPDFMVFTAIVPKLFGAKVILDVHDLMPELYQSKFGLPSRHPVVRFITWIERCSIGFADKAVAVHEPHLEALRQHGNPPEKFVVLLNLPDPRIFSRKEECQSPDKHGFELIYHGTVSKRHGLEIAIRAVSVLRNHIAGLKLRIIGVGDDLARLNALIDELDIRASVDVSKIMPLEELVCQIKEADVGIVPLLQDDFTRFMLPVKLLEYVFLQIPVICSRTSTIEAYFDETMVQYSTAGSVTELAENILFLYKSPDRRKELIANSEKFNRQFNWEKSKCAYYKMIDDLIGGKPGR